MSSEFTVQKKAMTHGHGLNLGVSGLPRLPFLRHLEEQSSFEFAIETDVEWAQNAAIMQAIQSPKCMASYYRIDLLKTQPWVEVLNTITLFEKAVLTAGQYTITCPIFSPSYLAEIWTDEFPVDSESLATTLRGFRIIEEEMVVSFLQKNDYLLNILSEARERITDLFLNPDLILRVSTDPEADELVEELVLYIRTNLSAREAIKLRNELYATWWYENLQRTKNNLSINLAFK